MNRILIWEGSRNIRPLMMIFSIRKKTSHERKEDWFYTTIKTQKPSTYKVRIIHPSSGTLELWEVLTWPSEGIWPAPHRCSLLGFIFFCASIVSSTWGRVTYCWFFGIISWRRLWEITAICKPYYRLPDKKLYSTYLLDGNHHQQSRRRTATHCPGEASPNPHSSSRTPHQAESWLEGTAALEEHSDGHPRGKPRRH